jgi:hypothetical protein
MSNDTNKVNEQIWMATLNSGPSDIQTAIENGQMAVILPAITKGN